jgi:diguanylate cyclase (GGDEF)-like protein
MFPSISDLLRVDPLTGCKNFLGFLEDCMEPDPYKERSKSYSGLKISPDLVINALQYSAVLFVAMNGISLLNKTKGFSHGDSAIRWMGILLQEETDQPVYRIWGTEFAVFLQLDTDQEHIRLLERILERVDREAKSLEFQEAPADIALILNDQSSTCLDNLVMQMGEAMVRVKNSEIVHLMVFHASDFKIPALSFHSWKTTGPADISFAIRWITCASIYHVIAMGRNLDMAQEAAFTDAISNLPNMKAAMLCIDEALRNARADRKPFSILLIDGDNTKAFNLISYAAGDEMIREISAVLKQNSRPEDFVARYRNGDEFIIILPNTTGEDARHAGERFRLAVKNASQSWKIPATVSIGISSYPANGEDLNTLIDTVETANKQAKSQGKDQVVLADENTCIPVPVPLTTSSLFVR